MSLNLAKTRAYLQSFDFARLFVEELGWEPPSKRRSETASIKGVKGGD